MRASMICLAACAALAFLTPSNTSVAQDGDTKTEIDQPDPDASAKSSGFVTFGSQLIEPDRVGTVTDAICYLSNVSKDKVRVKDFRLFEFTGVRKLVTSNCGKPDGFDLRPNSSCYIYVHSDSNVACAALVDKAQAVRGSVELRAQNTKVVRSAALTAYFGKSADRDFETISTPPFYGAPDQKSAFCAFSNLGSKVAKVRKIQLVRSDGQKLPLSYNSCAEAKTKLKPGKSCVVAADNIGATDLQCRAEVTQRSHIRGAMTLSNNAVPDSIVNSHALQ